MHIDCQLCERACRDPEWNKTWPP